MLKIGILGLSSGNGHPYSWSAIFNGYDRKAMADCPFPSIPRYLAERRFPDDAIPGAQVTHVWTQDPAASRDIARACMIPKIVKNPTDMLGHVDAVLLARDDAENHRAFAAPFLRHGLPVYVDKPLAITDADRRALLDLQVREGQVFTCSALRYAAELQISPEEREAIGRIRLVQGVTPKSWERYAVHLIDPVIAQLGLQGEIVWSTVVSRDSIRLLRLEWASGLHASFDAVGDQCVAPISLRFFGEKGFTEKTFKDSFMCFRRALEVFVAGVRAGNSLHDESIDAAVVRVIEAGLERGAGGGA